MNNNACAHFFYIIRTCVNTSNPHISIQSTRELSTGNTLTLPDEMAVNKPYKLQHFVAVQCLSWFWV